MRAHVLAFVLLASPVLSACARYAPVRVRASFEGADHATLDETLSAMSAIGMPFVRDDAHPDVTLAIGTDTTAPCIDARTAGMIVFQPRCGFPPDPIQYTHYLQLAVAHALGHLVGMGDLASGTAVMGGSGLTVIATGAGEFTLFTDERPANQDFHPTTADIAEFQRTHP